MKKRKHLKLVNRRVPGPRKPRANPTPAEMLRAMKKPAAGKWVVTVSPL